MAIVVLKQNTKYGFPIFGQDGLYSCLNCNLKLSLNYLGLYYFLQRATNSDQCKSAKNFQERKIRMTTTQQQVEMIEYSPWQCPDVIEDLVWSSFFCYL